MTLAVSIAGTGAAVLACGGDEHPVPDAPVGTISDRDGGIDGSTDAADARIDAPAVATDAAIDGSIADAQPPDAPPDAEPMG